MGGLLMLFGLAWVTLFALPGAFQEMIIRAVEERAPAVED